VATQGDPGRHVLRGAVSIAVGAAAVGGLMSCSSASPRDPAPVLAAAPSPLPVASLVPVPAPSPAPGMPAPVAQGSMCAVPDADRPGSGSTEDALVAVGRAPLSASLLWLPGLNSHTCRVQVTTLGGPAAAQLALDVLAAPAASSAPTTCPMDDGAAVTAYFRYGAGTDTEVIGIWLTGCSSVVAPDRAGRSLTAGIAQDLRAAAPSEWRQYLDTD
jgi:hypothetical protein